MKVKKRKKKVAKHTVPTLKTMAKTLSTLIVGIVVGLSVRYIWNMWMVPHSHLRVTWSDEYFTVENLGKAPVDWAYITARLLSPYSIINNFSIGGSVALRSPQQGFVGGNYLEFVATEIQPGDRGWVHLDIEGPPGIDLEVKSSCRYEIGGRETIQRAPVIIPGEEESYDD